MEQNNKPYLLEMSEVLAGIESKDCGLSEAEAAARLEANGPNKLIEPKKRSVILRFLDQMKDPMIIILLAAAALSFFTSMNEV